MPIFFKNVDRHFELKNIDADLRVSLVTQFLTVKAKSLLSRLPDDIVNNYSRLKEALLKEYSLTPGKYKKEFWTATKGNDETYIQFSTRLGLLWNYYLDSRRVKQSYEIV